MTTMMKKHNFFLSALLGSFVMLFCGALQGCIDESGIPYPATQANFTEFDVRYQSRRAAIDTINRVVTVFLNDSANISAVEVTGYRLSPDMAALVSPAVLDTPLDLSDTLDIALKVYRECVWHITAVQTIDREFAVAHQIGASLIDPDAHTVTATVPSSLPLTAITVTSMKLGGATATVSPDIVGRPTDFSLPVTVEVTEHGVTTPWTITILQTDLKVDITAVDAWTGVAWVYAAASEGDDVSFAFRKAGTMAWTDLPATDVTASGAVFTARIGGLEPLTTYEVVAMCGDDTTLEKEFTTGAAPQLPNATFTQWWLDDKVWCPWAKDGDAYWGTGNKGAATLGKSNVVPLEDAMSPTGYAGAVLQTRFVGVSILGKLAAGSVFSGTYVATDGTNGILSFGRPFSERPTRLRARLKYTTATINYANNEMAAMKGQPDTCIVWCALLDRTEPYEIRTNPKNRQLFNPQDPSVVAYGEFTSGSSIDDFVTIDVPFVYRSTSRVPEQIIIVASSSKYGDYFTGGAGAELTLLGYELLYD